MFFSGRILATAALLLLTAGCGSSYDAFAKTPLEPIPNPRDTLTLIPVRVDSSNVRVNVLIPPPAEVVVGQTFPLVFETVLRNPTTLVSTRVSRHGRVETVAIPTDTLLGGRVLNFPVLALIDGFAKLEAASISRAGTYRILSCITFTDNKVFGPIEPLCAQLPRLIVRGSPSMTP